MVFAIVQNQTQTKPGDFGHRGLATHNANELYRKIHNKAWLRRIWSRLTGNPDSLLDLSIVSELYDTRGSHDAGTQTVLIEQIRGSEGRCEDFDAEFRPLRKHNQERWRKIAVAHQMDRLLPPVELIQVGDTYFVRDGHHRVSVARTFGQKYIEAHVTVWQVAGLVQ
ncbi:MAG: hypothetical protein JXA14_04655 [Anaerolineae bacterium]|jgi:hypothetical protein|nr:hypothetical protein [Anaerolineae bacterium]